MKLIKFYSIWLDSIKLQSYVAILTATILSLTAFLLNSKVLLAFTSVYFMVAVIRSVTMHEPRPNVYKSITPLIYLMANCLELYNIVFHGGEATYTAASFVVWQIGNLMLALSYEIDHGHIKTNSNILLLLIAMTFAMSGCYTQKKAQSQVNRAYTNYPMVMSKSCLAFFPPKDSVITQFEYVKGEVQYIHDSVKIDCDSVVKYGNHANNKTITIPCPPCKNSTDTIRVKEVQWRENTKQVDYLQSIINDMTITKSHSDSMNIVTQSNDKAQISQLKNANKKLKGKLSVFFIMGGLLFLLLTAWQILKIKSKLILP